MKQLAIILTLLLSFGFSQIMLPDTSKMSDAEKMMWYQNEKKSPALAVLCSFFLPSSGHAYAGNWKRGLKITAIKYSLFLAATHLHSRMANFEHNSSEHSRYEVLSIGFYLGTLGVSIYELIDAAGQTKKYNNQLYKNLFGTPPSMQFNLIPQPKGISLGLSYNF